MDVNPQTESSGPTDPQTYSGLIGQDFNPQTESSGEFDVESSERRTLHQVMWEMPCREAVRPLGRMEFLGEAGTVSSCLRAMAIHLVPHIQEWALERDTRLVYKLLNTLGLSSMFCFAGVMH